MTHNLTAEGGGGGGRGRDGPGLEGIKYLVIHLGVR